MLGCGTVTAAAAPEHGLCSNPSQKSAHPARGETEAWGKLRAEQSLKRDITREGISLGQLLARFLQHRSATLFNSLLSKRKGFFFSKLTKPILESPYRKSSCAHAKTSFFFFFKAEIQHAKKLKCHLKLRENFCYNLFSSSLIHSETTNNFFFKYTRKQRRVQEAGWVCSASSAWKTQLSLERKPALSFSFPTPSQLPLTPCLTQQEGAKSFSISVSAQNTKNFFFYCRGG